MTKHKTRRLETQEDWKTPREYIPPSIPLININGRFYGTCDQDTLTVPWQEYYFQCFYFSNIV